MSENLQDSTKNFLVVLLSFFLGIFLFLFSFVLLYFNEFVGKDLLSSKEIIKEEKTFSSSAKILTLESKKAFLGETKKSYLTISWIFRGFGFFLMFFGLTLILITLKGRKNIYGYMAFASSFILSFLVIIFSKAYIIFQKGDFSFKKLFSSLFPDNFFDFSKFFDFKIDIYLILGIIFLIFLIFSIFFSFLKIFKKNDKGVFKNHKKGE